MRLRWLDLLRSLAIVGMIVYHTAYDLQFFYDWNLNVTTGSWKIFQVAVAALFLVVSGISAGFWATKPDALSRGFRRGLWILSAAMLVSLVTAIVDETTWVRFGILHLIALSAFILPLLRRLHPLFIAGLGILCIALTPLDLMPAMNAVDYTPPVPWLGAIVLGFAVGIPLAKRTLHLSTRTRVRVLLETLAIPGRYSLIIYLVHQPVILGVLWVVMK